MFPSEYPWQVRMRFTFDKDLKDAFHLYPGISWKETKWGKEWVAPYEALPYIESACRQHKHRIERFGFVPGVCDEAEAGINQALWPFQRESVLRSLGTQDNGFVFNFEMGLGKTPSLIESLRLRKVRSGVIVAPAMVLPTWKREIDKWWPDHPEVTSVTDGKLAMAQERQVPGILLVSYGLLHKLPPVEAGAIVFDELHYLQGEYAGRTLASNKLLRANPTAWRAGLTGTLITNHPLSMWKPLDVLFPGRFGTKNQFGARYCHAIGNEYGNKYVGANEEFAAELRERLDLFSARHTKNDPEIRKLLPPFIVQRVYTANSRRFSDACELADAAVAQDAKVVVLTRFRASAGYLHGLLEKQWERSNDKPWLGMVTGENVVGAREKVLAAAQAAKAGVLVATMESVGIGIDLTWADEVIFAELNYSPVIIAQAFGRFSRLSGKKGVTVKVMLQEGKDPIGEVLAAKFEAMGSIIESGQAETGIEEVLAHASKVLSKEEMNKLLADMASEGEY